MGALQVCGEVVRWVLGGGGRSRHWVREAGGQEGQPVCPAGPGALSGCWGAQAGIHVPQEQPPGAHGGPRTGSWGCRKRVKAAGESALPGRGGCVVGLGR